MGKINKKTNLFALITLAIIIIFAITLLSINIATAIENESEEISKEANPDVNTEPDNNPQINTPEINNQQSTNPSIEPSLEVIPNTFNSPGIYSITLKISN